MIYKYKNQIKNIAVCISGEPRFYKNCAKNINNFFNYEGVNVHYFAHIWNSNTLKTNGKPIIEKFSVDGIEDSVKKYFNFEKLKVEEKFEQSYWLENMYYSEAFSNFLKCQFEKENNMKFDIVVKCRTDLAFEPGQKFLDILHNDKIKIKTIYANNWPLTLEWLLPNVDDCFYFGDSMAMDIIMQNMPHVTENVYKELRNDISHKDNPYMMYGPGVSMYQWIKQVNMTLEHKSQNYFIFRDAAKEINLDVDYEKALQKSKEVQP